MFRERALQRRGRPEPLDDLLQVTAPHEWLILAGLAVIIAALIAFVLLGRVDRTVAIEGVLVLPGERHYVVAPVSGTVTEVLVGETDTVAKGQPLAYVQTFAAQHRESVIVEIINTLENKGQLSAGAREELLLTLLTASGTTEPLTEIASPGDGKVVSLDLVDGQSVSAGDSVGFVRLESNDPPEVVAFISPVDAARLEAGMEASVSIAGSQDSPARVFQGQVADVSLRADEPPRWLLERGLTIPPEPHFLRVTPAEAWPGIPADGANVSLRVVLGRETLASLLAPGSGS